MSLTKSNGSLRPRNIFAPTSLADDFFNLNWPVAEFRNGDKELDWIPSANVKEDEKEFSIEVSVPGYTKKDIHVEIDSNNMLQVTGERNEDSSEKNEDYTRKEFNCENFSSIFRISSR